MPDQPNKPGGDFRDDGKVRDAGDEQAVKNQGGTTPDAYPDKSSGKNAGGDLYDQAVQVVLRDQKASTSYIQRKLAIGYNKAARLVEQMEEQGVVSPANHVGKREVLVGAAP